MQGRFGSALGWRKTAAAWSLSLFFVSTALADPETPDTTVESSTPLNVLFIAVDDLNDWVVGPHKHPQIIAPNFDRLASRGTSFTNAHAPAPLCGPSRAAIFTGLAPTTSGIYLHLRDRDIARSNEASAAAVLLPRFLAQRGYTTLGAGKLLHEGAGADLLQTYGGFKSFGPYPSEHFNWERPRTSTDWGPYPANDNQMPDSQIAGWTEARLERGIQEPFFLAVGFNRPHVPWHVPQHWFDLFDVEALEVPPYLADDLADVPEISRRIHTMDPTPSTDELVAMGEWQAVIQAYLASVAFVDAQLGRVLDALESSPYADNTLIILWSDHGYHLGEKGIVAKMTVWSRSSRVPFFVAGPGIPEDLQLHQPVSLLDIYPTLLDLLDIDIPTTLDGMSLEHLIENPLTPQYEPAIVYWGPGNYALHFNEHRYIRYEDGTEELYDVIADPNEWVNLAEDPNYALHLECYRHYLPENPAPMTGVNSFHWNEYWREKSATVGR